MRKAGVCVHFNGIQNECCKAGVNYKRLAGPEPGWANKLPCGVNTKLKTLELVKCDKFQEPTEAEIAEDKAAWDEAMRRMEATAPLVAKMKQEYKGKSGCRTFQCPACDVGMLTITISGYNGHAQGHCSTKGCVWWIE